jgi:transcriptional regulator with XRE-family HTH domain
MSKPSQPPKSIDARIREALSRLSGARRRRGQTQTTDAEAMGLSNSQYSRLESGNAEMTLRQFLVACEELSLEPSEVLGAPQPQRVADLKTRLSVYENKLAAISRALKVGDKDAWDK